MTWIQTYTGKKFNFSQILLHDFCIEDIAHALSNRCRFNGHCIAFYSVAEHSIAVSRIAPSEVKLHCLLHDAAEAYLPDIPSPIKPYFHFNLQGISKSFHQLEEIILNLIYNKLNILPPKRYQELLIKYYDLVMLATEKRDLMEKEPEPWCSLPEPLKEEIKFTMTPKAVRDEFLKVYHELTNG